MDSLYYQFVNYIQSIPPIWFMTIFMAGISGTFLLIVKFFKKNTVVCIAFFAAAITSIFVPPDAEYIGYFDFKTLTCLFCTLAVVCALKNILFYEKTVKI